MTKTFSTGSLAYGSDSNAYLLELILTEDNVSQNDNTSRITYTLQLRSGSANRFQEYVTANLTIAGQRIPAVTVNKLLDYNSKLVLLQGQVTVSHNADGKLDMPFTASITVPTGNKYAPPSMSFSGVMTLTAIKRASTLSSAADIILGQACDITWTVNVATHRFKLKFVCGQWSYTTGVLTPGAVGAYRYTGYAIPLLAAQQFTGAAGNVLVSLYTYTDSGGTQQLGSADTKTFKATVPQNENTVPEITDVSISFENSLQGYLVQGVSRITATVAAADPYGANITESGYTIAGKSYQSGRQSDVIQASGSLKVECWAVSSRGFRSARQESITVLPYEKPKLENVQTFRCDATGTSSPTGTYLRIQANVRYSAVEVDGAARNNCAVSFQYRPYGGTYSPAQELSQNEVAVDSGPLNINLAPQSSYKVLVVATDDIGNTVTWENTVTSARVFRHKPPGGVGLGLGKMCGYDQETDGNGLLDTAWTIRTEQDVQVQVDEDTKISLREIDSRVAQLAEERGKLHFCIARAWGSTTFSIKTQYEEFAGDGGNRQAVFLFGYANATLVHGVLGVNNAGVCKWDGTTGVTATSNADGTVTVTLPQTAYDYFVCISAYTIAAA